MKDKKIFYSGDTGEYNLKTEVFTEIYYDCSSYDIEDFPHIGLNTLARKIDVDNRDKVYLMHFDSYDLICKAKELGFNVVEVENEEDNIIPHRKTLKFKGKINITDNGRFNPRIHID